MDIKENQLWKIKINNHVFCYCPECNNELCGTNSFVSDVNGIVTYGCSKCEVVSQFDFNVAPVPILIERRDYKWNQSIEYYLIYQVK